MSDLVDQFSTYDEVIGTAARTFAAYRASLTKGRIMWLSAERDRGALSAEGLTQFFPLERLTLVKNLKQKEALWTAEQALRSGAVELVVLEVLDIYTLTESRRLKLALEAGSANVPNVNLVAILPLAAEHSSTAAHTRWGVEPVDPQDSQKSAQTPTEQASHQRWHLLKNKYGTLKAWMVTQHVQNWNGEKKTALSMVPLFGNRGTEQT